jgi:hypothetical protein
VVEETSAIFFVEINKWKVSAALRLAGEWMFAVGLRATLERKRRVD